MQSDIDVKGFRSLLEGSEVEFVAERSPDGRLKATLVTGPSGTPAKVCSLLSGFAGAPPFHAYLPARVAWLRGLPRSQRVLQSRCTKGHWWCAGLRHA